MKMGGGGVDASGWHDGSYATDVGIAFVKNWILKGYKFHPNNVAILQTWIPVRAEMWSKYLSQLMCETSNYERWHLAGVYGTNRKMWDAKIRWYVYGQVG